MLLHLSIGQRRPASDQNRFLNLQNLLAKLLYQISTFGLEPDNADNFKFDRAAFCVLLRGCPAVSRFRTWESDVHAILRDGLDYQ